MHRISPPIRQRLAQNVDTGIHVLIYADGDPYLSVTKIVTGIGVKKYSAPYFA